MTKEEFQIGFFEFLDATADKLDDVAKLSYLEMRRELHKMADHMRRQVAIAEEKRLENRLSQ